MQRLLLLGLNHTTAPLSVRERLAFNTEQRAAALAAFQKRFPDCEAVLLSTCNRVELYVGRPSLASVAVDLPSQIFYHFDDKVVLNIGAGKMAALVLKHFAELSPRQLIVCNRDVIKAQALAQRFGGEAAAFERLDDHLST